MALGKSGGRRMLSLCFGPFWRGQELGRPEDCGPGFDLAVQVGQTWVQVFELNKWGLRPEELHIVLTTVPGSCGRLVWP